MTIPNVILGQKITEDMWNDVADTVNSIDRDGLIPIVEFSTNRTIGLDDRDYLLTLIGDTDRTVTIPHNSVIDFPIGAVVAFCQGGTGVLTIVPSAGVTIRSEGNRYTMRAQYAIAAIIKVDNNTWRLMGNIKP